MRNVTAEQRIIRSIIKAHGPVIDLRANPAVFIELARKYGFDLVGTIGKHGEAPPPAPPPLPGGVPERSPPLGPGGPDFSSVMREILKIGRKISSVEKKIG